MRTKRLPLLLLALLASLAQASGRASISATPRISTRSHTSAGPQTAARSRTAARSSTRCTACIRDSRGRIARSSTVKHEFQRQHPCPSTGRTSGACPGYVIDDITPLERGGADAPGKMQWQTKAAAKAKDRIE